MPKVKNKLEYRPNIPSSGNKHSTCGKVHPSYSHGDGGNIRTEPHNALYYCPEKEDIPNPMHGSEFAVHIITCVFVIIDLQEKCIIKSKKKHF